MVIKIGIITIERKYDKIINTAARSQCCFKDFFARSFRFMFPIVSVNVAPTCIFFRTVVSLPAPNRGHANDRT